MARARAQRSAQMELTSDGDSLHAAFPFSLAPPPGEASSSRIVVLYTETDLVATLRAEQAGMAQRSLLMGMMTLLICVAIWVGFWMPFARRLNQLVHGVSEQASAFDLARLPTEGGDELARISQAVRRMTVELQLREAQARESEAHLRQIVATSPGVICSFRQRADGLACFPYASPRMQELSGVPPEELARDASAAFARMHPDDAERVQQSIAESARALTPWREEFRIHHPTRGQLWIAGHSVPQREADGSTLWHGIVWDVTEAKQTEQKLRASQEQFQRIFQTGPLPAVLFALADARIMDVNTRFEEMVETSRAAAIGQTGMELGLWLDVSHREQMLSRLRQGESLRDFEARLRSRSGRVYDMVLSTQTLELPAGPAVLIQAIDVTARKKMETQLRESEADFRGFFENAGTGAVQMNEAGRFIRVNDQFCNLTGYSREELLGGLGPLDLDHPEEHEADRARLERFFQDADKVYKAEKRYVRKDGRVVWVRVSAQFVHDALGRRRFAAGIIEDITQAKQAEAARETTLEQLKALIASLQMGVLVEGPDRTILHTNQAFCRLFGLPSPEAILGADCNAAAQGAAALFQDPRGFLERVRQVLAVGDVVVGEALRVQDGRVFERDFVPVSSQDSLVGNMWLYRDVTERHRAERELRRLNRTYAVLSEINQMIVRERQQQAILDGVCRIAVERGDFLMAWVGLQDGPRGRVKLVAQAGATPDTLAILERFCSDPQQGCAFTAEALASGGFAVSQDITLDPRAESWRAAALQRGYRAMISLGLNIAGQPCGVFNLYADTADFFDADELRLLQQLAMDIGFALENLQRERERQEVEAERRRLAAAIEESADAVVITDAVGAIQYVNPAFETITGYSRKEALGQNPRLLRSGKHDDAFYRQMWTTLGRGEVWRGRFTNRLKNGQLIEVDAVISPVHDAVGQVVSYVAVQRDITAQLQLETQLRQSQKMEAIGQLAGGVAHDFNNLLAIIQGNAELLATEAGLTAEAQELNREILGATERASALTRQLLLFSRKQVMQVAVLNFNELIANLARLLRRIVGEDVDLQTNLHHAPLFLRADAGMLEQVVMNLVVNARDAMPAGGRLLLETTEEAVGAERACLPPGAATGRYVCLRVSDTGCGIPPQVLPRIFEPFFTTKEPGKGTGLGLATVFGIMQQHNGWITVESEPGRGTRFAVFLPPHCADPATAAGPAEPATVRGGTETILLVEDESALRRLTRMALERHGYRVLEAPDGVAALRLWREHQGQVALLLTDLVMPGGVSGRQLAQQAQADRPQIKIIYLSGYSPDIAGSEWTLRPGESFLQKPFPLHQLLDLLRRALDG